MSEEKRPIWKDIDFSNGKQLLELMDHADEFPTMLSSRNEDDELVLVSINPDNIVVETYQKNLWIRKNIIWRDGSREEMYDASLKKEARAMSIKETLYKELCGTLDLYANKNTKDTRLYNLLMRIKNNWSNI